MNKKTQLIAVFTIMSMALTYGLCMQIKTVNNNGTTVNLTAQQSKLKSEILKTSEKYDELSEQLDEIEKQLEIERESATINNSNLAIIEEKIKDKNLMLGLTEVTGTGVEIVLNDGNSSILNNIFGNTSDLLVHDTDLMHVINELFNSGAEAVAINGERIVATTAIECDGNVIKINGNKMGAPFEITAIGYPEQLAGGVSRPGGYLELLVSRGVVATLTKQNSIKIPKYTGTMKFNYAADAIY